MTNILSYVGMDIHSEVCLWTLIGLVRTIFDATLFKVNANLKQVWQMTMPDELSMPVQRILRTMISGVMLVQCFTVYVYLASYIVLLYPVFLEERPGLVLPWLLLAATRSLLCELTSLALGLGTCVLLGPAKPPCIKFLIVKLGSIMPAFYMWMLVYSYYHALKVAAAFKKFTAVLPTSDHDYGLELAVRRRRTKSLFGEDQLRTKIVASLYGEQSRNNNDGRFHPNIDLTSSSRLNNSPAPSTDDIATISDVPPVISDTGSYEDWYGVDVVVPRIADRIIEQFALMMLRIGAYVLKEDSSSANIDQLINSSSQAALAKSKSQICTAIESVDTETPHFVASSRGNVASYVRDYPNIFMKRPTEPPLATEHPLRTVHSRNGEISNSPRCQRRLVSNPPITKNHQEIERTASTSRKDLCDTECHRPQHEQREEENQPKTSKNGYTQPKSSKLKGGSVKSRTINDSSNDDRMESREAKPSVSQKHEKID